MPSHLQRAAVFAVLSLSFVSCSWQKGADTAAPAVAAQGTAPAAGRGAAGGAGRRGGGPVPGMTPRGQNKTAAVPNPAVRTAQPPRTGAIPAPDPRHLSTLPFPGGHG